MRHLACPVYCASLVALCVASSSIAAAEKSNVVFFLADDTDYMDVGAAHQSEYR
jgi:hypothetical protein